MVQPMARTQPPPIQKIYFKDTRSVRPASSPIGRQKRVVSSSKRKEFRSPTCDYIRSSPLDRFNQGQNYTIPNLNMSSPQSQYQYPFNTSSCQYTPYNYNKVDAYFFNQSAIQRWQPNIGGLQIPNTPSANTILTPTTSWSMFDPHLAPVMEYKDKVENWISRIPLYPNLNPNGSLIWENGCYPSNVNYSDFDSEFETSQSVGAVDMGDDHNNIVNYDSDDFKFSFNSQDLLDLQARKITRYVHKLSTQECYLDEFSSLSKSDGDD